MSVNTVTNKKWVVKKLPEDSFNPDTDVELVEETIDLAEVPAGKVLLQIEMLSCDAFVRTMLAPGAYHGSIGEGAPVPAFGYGKVVASSKDGPAIGTRMWGMVMAQTYALLDADGVHPVREFKGVPPSSCLNLMGLTTGMTAYVGVHVCLTPPKKGETVVVSAAAGAVGAVACQLAKATGARVIGIAGGAAKCAFLTEQVGCDGAVDYKDKSTTVGEQLDKLCPDGINFFYDNVGGTILEDVLNRIKFGSRVVLCGGISGYDTKGGCVGPSNYLKLAERGATMKGYDVRQYSETHEAGYDLLHLMHWKGDMKIFQTVKKGVEEYPRGLQGLFTGGATGKTFIEIVPGHDVIA